MSMTWFCFLKHKNSPKEKTKKNKKNLLNKKNKNKFYLIKKMF